MSAFDAVCHAMTAISTGGFANYDASAGRWDSPAIHWALIVSMLAGGLPMVRRIGFAKGDFRSLWADSQVRWYLAFLAVVSLGLAAWLVTTSDVDWEYAIRHATFNVVSVVTTTGLASTDYTLWGPFAIGVFLLLTPIGGCTGSTAGGIKVFRFEILFLVLRSQLQRQFSPNRVIPLAYQRKPVGTEIMISVMSFGFAHGLLQRGPRPGRDHRAGRQLPGAARRRHLAPLLRHAPGPAGVLHAAGPAEARLLEGLTPRIPHRMLLPLGCGAPTAEDPASQPAMSPEDWACIA